MTNVPYSLFRIGSGFSLVVVGVGFLLEPGRERSHKALGSMFSAIGTLFVLSVLSEFYMPPLFLDNLSLIVCVYIVGWSFFDINLYLFGDEAVPGRRRLVALVGASWSLFLAALPLLDLALGLPATRISIEDTRPMALFQSLASVALYLWPLGVVAFSLGAGRWHPSDIPARSKPIRTILLGVGLVAAILSAIGLAVIIQSKFLYRLFHSALEAMMLAWYFFIRSHPGLFTKARSDIGKNYKKRHSLTEAETARLAESVRRFVKTDKAFLDPDLDLAAMAKALGTPVYKLSTYMNLALRSSFSDWLNAVRVDHACSLLRDRPDMGILDIAFESGYSSKTVFNNQFLRRAGMTPREYRQSAAVKSPDSTK